MMIHTALTRSFSQRFVCVCVVTVPLAARKNRKLSESRISRHRKWRKRQNAKWVMRVFFWSTDELPRKEWCVLSACFLVLWWTHLTDWQLDGIVYFAQCTKWMNEALLFLTWNCARSIVNHFCLPQRCCHENFCSFSCPEPNIFFSTHQNCIWMCEAYRQVHASTGQAICPNL